MIGKYPAKLDEKNRLFVPAKLRGELGSDFYVTLGINTGHSCLTIYTAEEWDALNFDESKEEWADVVFCDAPCSGLGIMGKKRDIKYRLTQDSLKEVSSLQRVIVGTVWKYVKKGGILMYSTCTVNSEENEKQVQWITKNLPFEVVSMKEELPEELKTDENEYGLQLLPGIHETDGFFLCKLRRIG